MTINKYKICLLGKKESIYTRIVANKLASLDIDVTIYLEERINKQKKISKKNIINLLKDKIKYISQIKKSYPYKNLPLISFTTWIWIIRLLLHRRSIWYRKLIKEYSQYPHNLKIRKISKFNSEKFVKELNKKSFDIGILAGVGIINLDVINCFSKYCINTHPAKLPQCKGGGALEQTLLKELDLCATVHIVTEKIDDGAILYSKNLKLENSDYFDLLYDKLTIHCATTLVDYIDKLINSNIKEEYRENIGDINYWKDLTFDKQKKARSILKKTLNHNKGDTLQANTYFPFFIKKNIKLFSQKIPLIRMITMTKGSFSEITLKSLLIQKIIGINKNANWPVSLGSTITGSKYIRIGYNSSPGIMPGCYIFASREFPINIGSNCLFSSNVIIGSYDHSIYDYRFYQGKGEINIKDYCWISANSCILSGVSLGPHTIVAAGSVVTKSFEEGYGILAGVPAKCIKKINAEKCKDFPIPHPYKGYSYSPL